ncbi:MAG: TRAP transporter small permease [Aestuariivita sp.]|nr:TRAP transporter small permease [Aestuariivita sp.]MCY4201378.1 TRAP transporter small permease [Aestuariivita sp.]
MELLDKVHKLSEAVSRLAVWVGGISILAVTFLISAEVLLRKFFNISTGGADELSGYALAICFSWALSFTVLRRAHVRIDALYMRLPALTRPYVDCISIFSLTIFAIVLTYFCVQIVLDTIELGARSNTTLGTPLWIPQVLWLVGLLLFSCTCTLLSLLSISALIKGDKLRVHSLIGSRTTDEELATDKSILSVASSER